MEIIGDMTVTENSVTCANEVFIIGNGVIAKALAVILQINGRKVTILRGSIDGQAISTEHIEVEVGDEVLKAEISISALSNHEKLDGLILLTNKSFGNPALAEKLRLKAAGSPIVFLQNGLHIEHSFMELGFKELYRCVLLATSQSVDHNKVRFRLVDASPIGVIKGSITVLHHLVAVLNTSLFSFRLEADIQLLIWKKVISNCVFNSICPLLEIDNGVFWRNDEVLNLAKTVIGECLVAAHANGIQLTTEEVLANVLAISKMSDGQKISTYQDILNKRETEIDTLNFAVAKAAGGKEKVPVTALLGELTKIKSDLSRKP